MHYYVFDLAEQLADLTQDLSVRNAANQAQAQFYAIMALPNVKELAEFMLEDAKTMLRERYFGSRDHIVSTFLKVVRRICKDNEGNPEHDAIAAFIADCPIDKEISYSDLMDPERVVPQGEHIMNVLEDLLDTAYGELRQEVLDAVETFYRKGDIWSVELSSTSRALLFNFCCRKSAVEAAIRASGGNMADFMRHIMA